MGTHNSVRLLYRLSKDGQRAALASGLPAGVEQEIVCGPANPLFRCVLHFVDISPDGAIAVVDFRACGVMRFVDSGEQEEFCPMCRQFYPRRYAKPQKKTLTHDQTTSEWDFVPSVVLLLSARMEWDELQKPCQQADVLVGADKTSEVAVCGG